MGLPQNRLQEAADRDLGIFAAEAPTNNFHYSHMDEPVAGDIDLGVRSEKYASGYAKDEVRIIVENRRTHETVCELYPKQ